MDIATYTTLTATDIAQGVRDRRFTARAVTEAALARMEEVDPQIHAFATPDPEGARRAADEVDRKIAAGEEPGALAGVPVAIKDLVMTKGLRTTFGSRLYEDFIPEDDDVCVARLRAAGAIILGKSNASEFGFGAHGCNLIFAPTRNPWDQSRTPGGSSAGSAAAVAARICPLAIGSDGGGSIRIPAAFCNLFGFKASMGRVPVWPGCRDECYPGVSGWESVEHIGPITRTVADAALMMSALAGPDPRDRLSVPADTDWMAALGADLPKGLKIAYWPRWHDQPVDPEVAATQRAALDRLAAAFELDVTIEAPPEADLETAFPAIVALETDLTGLRALVARTGLPVTEAVSDLLAQPRTFEEATDAITTRKALTNEIARRMQSYDLILTPTVPIVAFAFDQTGPGSIDGTPVGADGWSPFTSPFNLTGQPAASLPCGFASGLPVGLQVVAGHLKDSQVLQACAAFERALAPDAAFPSLSAAS
ncbi:amidase [Thioclava sp. BHET1]|nr:amidase [Thioclava sp. BHET1]